jgi:hypothetical protein
MMAEHPKKFKEKSVFYEDTQTINKTYKRNLLFDYG